MKIVTHSGSAHRDEILAIALIAVKENLRPDDIDILRISECAGDQVSADFVVDIGRIHDPKTKRFDHHQFPADAPPDCTLTLVADHYGLKRSEYPWMDRVAILDSKGIFWWFRDKFGRNPTSAHEVAVALDDKTSIFSYIERVANKVNFHEALSVAYGWMKDEVDHIESRESNIAEARQFASVVELGGGHRMVYFDTEKLPPCGMALVDVMASEDPGIIVSGKRDERSDGFSATRLMPTSTAFA
jgi:hypothetical protein